ncbi:MAG: UbiA family prenyltransferase [Nitrososphaerota archaeon]
MSLAEWIRVGRIHTAALTMPVTLLGYVLAGGKDWVAGTAWALFGLWWHYVGFLQNNLFDLRYDLMDPEKRHFPLVKGTVPVRWAWVVDNVGLLVLLVVGVVLGGNPVSWSFLVLGVASGTVYNAFSKRTLLKPIPISLCFASLPLIPYTSLRPLDPVGMLLFASVFTTILYQIGVSGELKDVRRSEANILRSLGPASIPYMVVLKVVNLLTIYILGLHVSPPGDVYFAVSQVMLTTFSLMAIFLLMKQIEDLLDSQKETWDRDRALLRMSAMEIVTYYALVSAVTKAIGYWLPLWFVLPLLWFFVFNRFIFGTVTYPKV